MNKEEIDDLIKKEKITKSHGLMFEYLCEKMNKKITYVTGCLVPSGLSILIVIFLPR